MKLIKKNIPPLIILISLGLIIGTLAWGILDRLISHLTGKIFDLSVGPIGFDIGVLKFYIMVNPGSILGSLGGGLLFRSI